MATLTNISLMTYFTLVSIIGTLGNSIILLAYGNRWNSSKSTSVIFILILACVDLWTCLIVIPTIAIMEYRDFDIPTILCRFYSFSKNLIIISSLIISFIALDRFFNIALPHYRLLTPRRVKVLLTLFISIGIGLSTVAALSFSTQLMGENYLASYHLMLPNETSTGVKSEIMIGFTPEQNTSSIDEVLGEIAREISMADGANLTLLNLQYKSTVRRCFADTTIIPETVRDVVKHVSNKAFFTLIGIVTIFYSITFVLALQRQKPRIRALKKSLNVLNRFDSQPATKCNVQVNEASTRAQQRLSSSATTATVLPPPSKRQSNEKIDRPQYEMEKLLNIDDSDDLNPPLPARKPTKNGKKPPEPEKQRTSTSEGTSDELRHSSEKINGAKQVSFRIENRRSTAPNEQNKFPSISSVSLQGELGNNDAMYYKLPCPCSSTRQFLIKFHFIRPSFVLNRWLCCSCCIKRSTSLSPHTSLAIHTEDEHATPLSPLPVSPANTSSTHSNTLRKQLHRHRLQQIRMASTFLIITVSFVLFYLPSVLNAERIMKSPMMIYYLFLCTHALNPLIYCFMNPSLRAYVISMFKCGRKQQKRNSRGNQSFCNDKF